MQARRSQDHFRRALRAYFGLAGSEEDGDRARRRLAAGAVELIFGIGTGTLLLLHALLGSGSTVEAVLGVVLLGITAQRLLVIARRQP